MSIFREKIDYDCIVPTHNAEESGAKSYEHADQS